MPSAIMTVCLISIAKHVMYLIENVLHVCVFPSVPSHLSLCVHITRKSGFIPSLDTRCLNIIVVFVVIFILYITRGQAMTISRRRLES